MAAYTLTTPTIANGNGGIPHISGRGLRRRRLSRQDRVRLAADVIAREAQLDLSIRAICSVLQPPRWAQNCGHAPRRRRPRRPRHS